MAAARRAGEQDLHRRAAAPLGGKPELTAQRLGALLHALEPEARPRVGRIRPRRPVPRVEVGAADAVVFDLDLEQSVVLGQCDRGVQCRGVLGDVGQRFGNDEAGGECNVLGQPSVGQPIDDRDGQRRAGGERLDGGAEAAIGEHGRMDPQSTAARSPRVAASMNRRVTSTARDPPAVRPSRLRLRRARPSAALWRRCHIRRGSRQRPGTGAGLLGLDLVHSLDSALPAKRPGNPAAIGGSGSNRTPLHRRSATSSLSSRAI